MYVHVYVYVLGVVYFILFFLHGVRVERIFVSHVYVADWGMAMTEW